MTTTPQWKRLAFLSLLLAVTLVHPIGAAAKGPTRWEHAGGPPGGAIHTLVIDPQHAEVLFAGTPSGIYTSTNAGADWSPVAPETFACRNVHRLAVDTMDRRILYAGTDDGLYRSMDGGDTWTRLPLGTAHEAVLSLVVHPQYTRLLYAGSAGTVWRSADRGEHWESAKEGAPSFVSQSLAVHPWNPNIVYAGTEQGVYVTVDGGDSWHPAGSGLPPDARVQALTVNDDDPRYIYAGTSAGLYRSEDGGTTWHILGQAAGLDSVSMLLFVHDGKDTLYASNQRGKLYRSVNGGQTWDALGQLGADQPILVMAVTAGNPRQYYAGTARGAYKSTDGGLNWAEINQGIDSSSVRQIVDVPGTRDHLYAVTQHNLYQTQDGGNSWQPASREAMRGITHLTLDPMEAGSLYISTDQGRFYGSPNAEHQWTPIPNPPVEQPRCTALVVHHPASDDGSPMLYAAMENHGIWRWRGGKSPWEPLPTNLPQTTVQALALGARSLYAGVDREVYRLPLNAPPSEASWEKVTDQPLNGQITTLLAEVDGEDTLYVSTIAGGIYRGTGQAANWVNLSERAFSANMAVRSLAVAQENRETLGLYAVTDAGLFYSKDEGATWVLGNSGCVQKGMASCVAADDDAPGMVYVGTSGAGVYRGYDEARQAAFSLPPWLVLVPLGVIVAGAGAVLWRRRRRETEEPIEEDEEELRSREESISAALFLHNRVVPDMLITVPPALRVVSMRRYVDTHKNLDLVFQENPPAIEPAKHWRLQHFVENWDALATRAHNVSAALPLAAQITEQLCDLLGFTPLETRSFRSLFGYKIKAPAIRLSLPPEFPIIFVLERYLREDTITNVRDFMRVLNVTSFFAVLVVVDEDIRRLERGKELQRLVRGGADDLIVLDYHDLRSLFLARDPEWQLVDMILHQVDLTVVSPYVTSGPVPENMFFGRDYELKAVMRAVHDRNFAIVGGRKIGKTSVLNKVYRLMEQTRGFAPYYLDCQYVVNYEEFFSALASNCQVQIESASPDILRRVVLRLKRQRDGALILLLDEVDRLLAFDAQRQMRLFRVFRALAQEGLCRFVCCGERQFNAALHDPQSPLFNFANIIHLTYLNPRDARRIIEEPMGTMGLTFEDPEALPQSIVDLSSCHPNLVQAICQMLVRRVNDRGDRLIRLDDLTQVRSSDEFKDFFLEVTWGNATDLERLISLCMIDQPHFTPGDVSAALQQRGVQAAGSDVERALDGLTLFSILRKQGEYYSYAARSFPTLVAESQLAAGFVEGLVAKIQAEGM